jgi:hypothetical protein
MSRCFASHACPQGFAIAIGVASTFSLTSPARAETTTLSCEGTQQVGSSSAPWSGSIDIDYGASTISIPGMQVARLPATITDREIKFERRSEGYLKLLGLLDRLSGSVGVTAIFPTENWTINARCRPATQKF